MAESKRATSLAFEPDAAHWSELLEFRRKMDMGIWVPELEEREPGVDPYLDLLRERERARRSGRVFLVAHLAQSLDGKIATLDGNSQWISNEANLKHVHRLRALCDAVLVGRATAELDDPRLTVRAVEGRNPLRVLLTSKSREQLPPLRMLEGPDGCRLMKGSPREILARLARDGRHSALLEGGGQTVAGFLAEGCVDVLQVHVAPLFFGAGREAFPSGPHHPIREVAEARRMRMRSFNLDGELLLECRA